MSVEIISITQWASPTYTGYRVVIRGAALPEDSEPDILGLLVADIHTLPNGDQELLLVEEGGPVDREALAAALQSLASPNPRDDGEK